MRKDGARGHRRRTRITLVSSSPHETRRLGARVGRHLKPGDVVCLVGEMGTGKTLFTRGIAEALGVPRGRGVRSPTFTLIHEYQGRHPIYHLDLYRIRVAEELEGIGWDEVLSDTQGVVVIEGAEKMQRFLPEERLDVFLEREGPRRRRLSLVGSGRRFEVVVGALAGRRRR